MKKSNIVRYVIGGIFIFFGLTGLMSAEVIGWICMLLFGISLFPNVYEKLNISDKKGVQIIAPIVLFFMAFSLIPTTETENTSDIDIKDVMSTAVVVENVIENTIEYSKEIENDIEVKNEIIEGISNVVSNTIQEDEEKEEGIIEEEIIDIEKEEQVEEVVSEKSVSESSNSRECVESSAPKTESKTAATTYTKIEPTYNTNLVWIPQTGKKYHSNPSCSGMNGASQVSQSDAVAMGYTACKKCY